MLPYLPDIMKDVVARVDAVFSVDTQDAFNVYFDYGIYSQVSKNIYKSNPGNFPLVWLVMKFHEDRGKDFGIYADVTCRLIIAMPTKTEYTQAERDEEVFKPRLIPIYEELMNQIFEESRLSVDGPNKIKHTRILQPYWGGGDVNGLDNKNLFENYIDAIDVQNLQLKLKHYSPVC